VEPPQLLMLEPHTSGTGLHFAAEGSYLYGPVHGFLQTPAGGAPGSSSRERPSFGEIGIDNVNVADAALTVGYDRHEVFFGAQFIEPTGSATLRQDLVTNGVTFPAGTRVSSSVKLDWYRLGYRYRWELDSAARGDREPQWTLYPSLGAALFTFDYRLDGSGGQHASRSYSKALPQVGLELDWRPGGGPFTLSAGAMGFPPISSIPAIATENVTAKYRFFGKPGSFNVEGFVGVQFEQMYYKDNQRVPNHIEAQFGPMVVAGLSVGL
jgi:hypothetical protein